MNRTRVKLKTMGFVMRHPDLIKADEGALFSIDDGGQLECWASEVEDEKILLEYDVNPKNLRIVIEKETYQRHFSPTVANLFGEDV